MLHGSLPRIHQEGIRPQRAYRDYYQTYVERDVRKLIAQEKQLGVSSPQLKRWLGVLEASFIVYSLPP